MVLLCVVLAAGTSAAYWGLRNAGFVNYDDPDYLSENWIVQQGLTFENVKWAFQTTAVGHWQPVTLLSYMADCHFFGLHAQAHHLVNLALHVANSCLLLCVLASMTRALWPSAMVAALFALHPTHVESVAWIAERKDVLSTFFGMLTLWTYFEYVKRKCAGWYIGALLFFVLGLLSKASLLTLPFALLLLDFWPLKRLRARWIEGTDSALAVERKPIWSLVLEKGPFFLLAAASGFAAFFAAHKSEAVASFGQIGLSARLANAAISYIRYIGKTIWPTDLSVFYPYPEYWPSWQVAGALLLLTAVSVTVTLGARRRPYLFTGWFWFVGTLLPVIGITQAGSQAMADRYLYVSGIGLYIAVVWGLRELPSANRMPKIGVTVMAMAVLMACAWATARQVEHWQSSLSLFTHAGQVTAPNPVVLNKMGHSLHEVGKTNEAREMFLKANQLNPGYPDVWANLGSVLLREGKDAEATDCFRRALDLRPNSPELHYNIAVALAKQGRPKEAIPYYLRAIEKKAGYFDAQIRLGSALIATGDINGAITNYAAAVRLKPGFAPGHYNLGTLNLDRGKLDEALKHLAEAVRLKPDYADAHRQLGLALAKKGDFRRAREHLETALRLNPNDARAHVHLAILLEQLSETERAIAEYEHALQLDPNLVEALNNLAWLKATHPEARFRDGPKAVQLAERACELTQRGQAFALGTLGAAYAEAGRFEDAIKSAEQAVVLATAKNQSEIAQKNGEMLKAYVQNQPWREARP